MSKKIQFANEFYGVPKESFDEMGVFNRIIGSDVLLYVDPFLFDGVQIEEFKGAREEIKTYFSKVIKLLQIDGDRTFKKAIEKLTFKERSGFGTGYGSDNDSGNCIGSKLAEKLAISGREIIKLGIDDPEIFELLGLIEDGFGADRISDMTINILFDRFVKYTNNIAEKLKIEKRKKIKWNDKEYNLPYDHNRKLIYFIPQCVLRDLPTALDKDSIDIIVSANKDIKDRMNRMIGDDRKKITIKERKRYIKQLAFSDPSLMNNLIKTYKAKEKTSYNTREDPVGKISWLSNGKDIAEKYPILIEKKDFSNINDLAEIVVKIIEQTKKVIENNGCNKLLYDKNKVRDERYFQHLFFAIADSYCVANKLPIDISPESNAGRGPVDFKFSYGKSKVLVEIKKDDNDLMKAITKQLPEYMKSESADIGILLIFKVGESLKKIETFEKHSDVKNAIFPYYIIDSFLYPSASKLKR